jgi:hypothetical protein
VPAIAEPPVRLHRVALRQGEKREIPHRMMPDTRCPGLQHDLRDLGNLQRAGLVTGTDLECAESDDRGRVQGPGNEWASPGPNRPSSASAASVKFPICSISRPRVVSKTRSAQFCRSRWAATTPASRASSASSYRSVAARIHDRSRCARRARGSPWPLS